MHPSEVAMARAFGAGTYAPGSDAQRFALIVSAWADQPEPSISERQAGYLRYSVYKFREQLPAPIVALAGDVPTEMVRRRCDAKWGARPRDLVLENHTSGQMACLPLRDGRTTLVDVDVWEWASRHLWSVNGNGYVNAAPGLLHRLIMKPARGLTVDHVNRDRLDNRRENLRVCTYGQNNAYIAKRDGLTSIYKGVHRSHNGKWDANIRSDGKSVYLGRFANERDAARAFDRAALVKWGEYAALNFPVLADGTGMEPDHFEPATPTRAPHDPNALDLFADLHPENIPDDVAVERPESIPTNDEGREATGRFAQDDLGREESRR